MAILVTGGAGYIGSHTARALRHAGYEVVLYDNLSTGVRRLAQGFELIEGDIADNSKLRPVLARRDIDAVLHFAAHAYVGESAENPRKYFHNNVLASLNLLNSALDAGIRSFVFSSSCAVYGIAEKIPITARTGESLWRVEALFRKRARSLRPRLWTMLGGPALFQCCGG
jgi:UDP-glucose 4-epimerase